MSQLPLPASPALAGQYQESRLAPFGLPGRAVEVEALQLQQSCDNSAAIERQFVGELYVQLCWA